MERLTKRVTFANVVALMALVLAMAGTGVADPLAHSAATTLGIAKQANKRAVNATKSSEKALKRGSQALTLGPGRPTPARGRRARWPGRPAPRPSRRWTPSSARAARP